MNCCPPNISFVKNLHLFTPRIRAHHLHSLLARINRKTNMATRRRKKTTPAGKKRPAWDWVPIGPPIRFLCRSDYPCPLPPPLSLNLPRQGG